MDQQQQGSQSSPTKVERKIVEKNRRNHMKNLYSELNSLLPTHNPKEAMPLPDQISEAINYIKSLETKLKLEQEKKERLMGRKRTGGGCSSSSEVQGSLKSPNIEIHETGNWLVVILTCGVGNQFLFCEIIRMLHAENIEVINAYTRVGDSLIDHVVHGKVQPSIVQFGGTKVSEKLKLFVKGFFSDVEMEPELMWDFAIDATDPWGFQDLTLDNVLPSNPL